MNFEAAMRVFRLSAEGVNCGADGLRVGGVRLLERRNGLGASQIWAVRAASALDRELTARYGQKVTIARKLAGLDLVARALDRGELSLAQITALLLEFPDPPRLGKMASPGSIYVELYRSGLAKDEDFEEKHPGTGTPPNPGRFATKPKPERDRTDSANAGRDWPSRAVNAALRSFFLKFILQAAELSPQAPAAIVIAEVVAEAWELLHEFETEDFATSQQRINDQLYAALQPPKTLEELQVEPDDHLLGYEQHHVVEENPTNMLKDGTGRKIEALKFGSEIIDDPSNLVGMPRLIHEQISNWYSEKDPDDAAGRTRREVISQMDYDTQREIGLPAMRVFGALQ